MRYHTDPDATDDLCTDPDCTRPHVDITDEDQREGRADRLITDARNTSND